jgi:hypothetical protein
LAQAIKQFEPGSRRQTDVEQHHIVIILRETVLSFNRIGCGVEVLDIGPGNQDPRQCSAS